MYWLCLAQVFLDMLQAELAETIEALVDRENACRR
jgi:hypothetical protein